MRANADHRPVHRLMNIRERRTAFDDAHEEFVRQAVSQVSAYERTIFLEPDFEVGPGPKYHVYLVPKSNVRREADVKTSMFVDLGRLRAFKGSQRYPIPDGVKLKDYASVVIWCEQFGVLISPADLMVIAR